MEYLGKRLARKLVAYLGNFIRSICKVVLCSGRKMTAKSYNNPESISGNGSDIKWCGRWRTSKVCLFCRHHKKFDEWIGEWKYHYLVAWTSEWWWPWKEHRGARRHFSYEDKVSPRRYASTGLTDYEIRRLLKKGCNSKKKCICVKLAQGGSWYCQDCFEIIETMARINRVDMHEMILRDRRELKEEYLMMYLSGSFSLF